LTTREIHTIPQADINAHFAQPTADRSGISQIPQPGRIKARKDPGLSARIAQPTKPFAEDVRLSELVHNPSVSV
jgi:hypothetical protein